VPGTDKLASYGVAHRRLIPGVVHRRSKYLNNRAENSHQTTIDGDVIDFDATLGQELFHVAVDIPGA